MTDFHLEPTRLGRTDEPAVLVQPLSGEATRWLEENAEGVLYDGPVEDEALYPWTWLSGGALAVETRRVDALVKEMTAAGLEVEGYEVPEGADAPGSVEDLEAYVNAQRTLAKVEGDRATVKAMDAVGEAEKKGLSPLALHLAGDAARAHEEGLSMLEWQRDIVKRHGEAPAWHIPTVEELKRADLLPWKETSPRKET